MATRIVFTGKGQVEVASFQPEPLAPGTVRVRARQSLISTGTEGICLHRLFDPGTHWERWLHSYPFATGYCLVGEVEEVGDGVPSGLLGQLVVTRAPHASEVVVPATSAFGVPEEVSTDQACWFALGMIALMGTKAGRIRLGHSLLVVGAGPVGQMQVRWAHASGADRVGVLDPVAMRLDLASRGGATILLEGRAEGAAERVAEAFGGDLPDIVVDTTGIASVFEECLALPRRLGTLVLLGDTGTPSQQRLTPDVISRGIRIHGAHVSHEEGEWTERRCIELFFRMVQTGRINLDRLITHRFEPHDAPEAYRLTTERRTETMGVVFDWPNP